MLVKGTRSAEQVTTKSPFSVRIWSSTHWCGIADHRDFIHFCGALLPRPSQEYIRSLREQEHPASVCRVLVWPQGFMNWFLSLYFVLVELGYL